MVQSSYEFGHIGTNFDQDPKKISKFQQSLRYMSCKEMIKNTPQLKIIILLKSILLPYTTTFTNTMTHHSPSNTPPHTLSHPSPNTPTTPYLQPHHHHTHSNTHSPIHQQHPAPYLHTHHHTHILTPTP